MKRFIVSRGCVLSCSFCYISALKDVFGLRIRKKSPERVMQDIIYVKENQPLAFVHFSDDFFPIYDRKWLIDFCKLWKDHIKLPFSIFVIANFINDEVARYLKEAGCRLVFIGIETYNEKTRTHFLEKKGVSNRAIESAFESLKKFGIYVGTTNIIGLPGETTEDWFKTSQYNNTLKADLPMATEFTYIPNTKIGKMNYRDSILNRNEGVKKSFVETFFLCASSKIFLSVFRFLINSKFSFLINILKLLNILYSSFKMKKIYSVRFIDGLKYFILAGSINKRKNVLNGLS